MGEEVQMGLWGSVEEGGCEGVAVLFQRVFETADVFVCRVFGYAAFDVGGFCSDVEQTDAYGRFCMAF